MQDFLKQNGKKLVLPVLVTLQVSLFSIAQEKIILPRQDSINRTNTSGPDQIRDIKNEITKKKNHSPRTAAIRSALIPGWGQVYNKKYWKVPLVYGALGVTAGIFFYNLKNYRDTRFAYNAKYKASLQPPLRDSTDYFNIKPALLPLSMESLRSYRNQFRRDMDYSALYFLLAWAVNVLDATVDAHLKTFDVSRDLSLEIKPRLWEVTGARGVSLVLNIGKTGYRSALPAISF